MWKGVAYGSSDKGRHGEVWKGVVYGSKGVLQGLGERNERGLFRSDVSEPDVGGVCGCSKDALKW